MVTTLNSAEAQALTAAEEANDRFFDDEANTVPFAHDSLALSPLCADAYVNLAIAGARGPAEELFYWHAAELAGRLALGTDAFTELKGDFWGFLETRPYMRAKHGLAVALWAQGERKSAIGHAEDMLRLNPNDNQGVRYLLLEWYLQSNMDKKAAALLKRYRDDHDAGMLWGAALLAYRSGGDSGAAKAALEAAMANNRHVGPYLTATRKLPKHLPESYTSGSVDEAVIYVSSAADGWKATRGALAWLKVQLAESGNS